MIFFNKKKKSEKDKENVDSVAKGNILIRVYMRFGAEIRQKRAEYFAIEKRDNYNNLVAISDDDKITHNEDVDFTQENVYSAMNTTLGIAGMPIDEATVKLDSYINKYEKRVKAIDKHPELNKFANIWDEKRRLRELNIYKRYLKNRSENGAYFKLEEGIRVYEYESIGGFLIPIWHGVDNLVDYPDFTNKKKITMQETANINAYFESKGGKQLIINAVVILMIINAVLFCTLMFAGFKIYGKSADLDLTCNQVAIDSARSSLYTIELFNEVMRSPFIQEEIENIKSDVNNTNNAKIKELIPFK